MRSSSALFLCALLLVLTTFRTATAANIVQNGDFEILGDHDFPPWQFSNGFGAFVNEPQDAYSGRNFILPGGLMWQNLNTVIGQAYQLSYHHRGDDPGQTARTSVLNVSWGSQLMATHTESNFDRPWDLAQFTVTASATTTRLTFQNASRQFGHFGHPSIDLIQVIPVPEPSIFTLAVTSLAALFLRRRQRAYDGPRVAR